MSFFRLFVALGLGGFFIYSGAIKTSHLEQFATDIAQYQILPQFLCQPAAWMIPLLELIAGIFLLLPKTRRWGAFLVLFLMATFLFALTSALFRGLNIHCGCLGSEQGSTNLWPSVWRDIAIASIAALLAWSPAASVPSTKVPFH